MACLQGLPLPPLEVWAASADCLRWLASPAVGVTELRFRRRAPATLDGPAGSRASAGSRGSASDSADTRTGENIEDAEAPAPAASAQPFRPSRRREAWRHARSAGVAECQLTEWPVSFYDRMMCELEGVNSSSGRAAAVPTWSLGGPGWRQLQASTVYVTVVGPLCKRSPGVMCVCT